MKSNLRVPEQVQSAGHAANQGARAAASSRWMTILARLGYGAKGVVYLIIGWLAVQVAIGIVGRLGYAVTGVSYAILAFGAFQLVTRTGTSSTTKSTTTSTQDVTAQLLNHSWGVAVVVLLGLIVLGVAGYLFSKAYTAKFQRRLVLTGLSTQFRRGVIFLGRFGYAALGVVFSIIGIFLIVAAVQHNPNEAKGLDAALGTLAQQPFGQLLLGIVALGLVAYGVYSFVEARFRRVGVS